MTLACLVTGALCFAGLVSSRLFGPNIARHKSIVANYYDGPYRPQIHFSPPYGFMNDPNGLFRDANGTWHLYYQIDPTGLRAGNQHWGHATSLDLYHWVNQPLAIFPPAKDVYVFSGSVVVDSENTSGFFPNQDNGVVAIYTLAPYNADGSPGPQQQAISFSYDGGYTFTPYKGNPVIPGTSPHFRDPKVIRHEGKWVMAVAYPVDFAIGIFVSSNLIDWEPTSNFSHAGIRGDQWECPNLVPMPYTNEAGVRQGDTWLMLVSINPGAPLGGSITQFFPGAFDGRRFTPVDSAARLSDFAKDNYAGQFFYGLPEDEDPVSIAWASNWQYTQDVPTDKEGWRSAMSLPRRMHLVKTASNDWKLAAEPYDLSPVKGEPLAQSTKLRNEYMSLDFEHLPSNALYWEASLTDIAQKGMSNMAVFNVSFESRDTAERLTFEYSLADGIFSINRGDTRGFKNAQFSDKFWHRSPLRGNEWSMTGVIDRSVAEVFLNNGLDSATVTFYAQQPLTRMVIGSAHLDEETCVSASVRGLRSGWKAAEAPNELVGGNDVRWFVEKRLSYI
ncbi:hypothetical protein CDD81_5504 [Ophiocordyceps australis]|uniref:Glycosyl hydrolase family 32 N-terminal domain-containing protein n=1 Tax=Ophiocordyceps australis TaxID=1399860 RepID=A0A2C5XA07_9HYPO|nr:hypothetical protein CDD81_5504 [Ophiocordyceps australis]